MMKLVMALALGTVAATGSAAAQDDVAPHRGGGMGMMRADTNGDGVVTRAECTTQVDARFERMDANGDGRLDPDEMPRFGMRRGGRGTAPGGDMPPPAGTTPPPPPPAGPMTRDQFRAMSMARFDRFDINRDGKLDASEMPRFGGRGGPGGQPGPQPTPPAN